MLKKTTIFWLVLNSLFDLDSRSQGRSLRKPCQRSHLIRPRQYQSGWKCDATKITVTIDDGGHDPVAMHQQRGDQLVAGVCNGTINRRVHHADESAALFFAGEHVVVAYDNGAEFARGHIHRRIDRRGIPERSHTTDGG